MAYIAVACLAVLLVALVLFAETVRRLLREHARERQLLTNQVLHLSGRTWQPPPTVDTPDDHPEPVDESLSLSMPDFE